VISGPDGVGKSTVLNACVDELGMRGAAAGHFHHVADANARARLGSKRPWQTRIASNGINEDPGRTWLRSLIPDFVKVLLASAIDEYNYVRRIQRKLNAIAAENKTALVDRYVHDRMVSLAMMDRPLVQRFNVQVASVFMQRPTRVFVLCDSPSAIHARKPELSEGQIELYMNTLINVLRKKKTNYQVIRVGARGPKEVASEIVDIICCSEAIP